MNEIVEKLPETRGWNEQCLRSHRVLVLFPWSDATLNSNLLEKYLSYILAGGISGQQRYFYLKEMSVRLGNCDGDESLRDKFLDLGCCLMGTKLQRMQTSRREI